MTIISVFRLLVLLVMVSSSVYGLSYQEQVLQAHEAYKSGDYQTAHDLYQGVPQKSPQLYYNIGNCLYKQGKLGHALLFWKKAERDWGFLGKHDLYENMTLATDQLLERAGINKEKATQRGWARFLATIMSFLRSTPLLWFQLFFLFFWSCFLVVTRFFSRAYGRLFVTASGLLVCIAAGLLIIKYNLRAQTRCIVVSARASLMSGPGSSDEYRQLGTVHEGLEGQADKASSGYIKVMFDTQRGWVKEDDLGMI